MTTKTTILVDANSVGYAEHSATKLRSGSLETQAIFGFVHKMRKLKARQPCRILVLWDGRAQWRFDLWPQYKSNRDNDPKKVALKEAYSKQRPYIAKALEHLGVEQVTGKFMEADDWGGHFATSLSKNPANKIILYTGDHDWMQLVRENVTWEDPKDESNIVTHENFLEKTGYQTPLQFLEGKCLHGDTSDVIPGVGGLGKDTAPLFLARWGSVGKFLKAVDSGAYVPASRKDPNAKTMHPEQNLASIAGRKAFLRNLKLMQLQNVKAPHVKDVTYVKGELDKDKFQALCEELAFFSITKNIDNFLLPFESK